MQSTDYIHIIPVLPSADINRDVAWYREKLGMTSDEVDSMYAVLYRDQFVLHLQWHADTPDDPLLGGSVVRVLVRNIQPLFEEMVERGTAARNAFRTNTPWRTNEFGFFDLNRNAIFFMEESKDQV
jgi:catechol 2,3-dioxygenase-like lactoylglutathione lyase family enzyme